MKYATRTGLRFQSLGRVGMIIVSKTINNGEERNKIQTAVEPNANVASIGCFCDHIFNLGKLKGSRTSLGSCLLIKGKHER